MKIFCKARLARYIILFLATFIFSFSQGQHVSLDSLEKQIDSVVTNAIQQEAFPGCVVYASQRGQEVFHKAYGFQTYDSAKRVHVSSVYDLASITKVTASTLALMKLYEEGHFQLDEPIGKYMDGMGKAGSLTFRECLAHQSGLKAWIPYYKEARKKNGAFRKKTFSKAKGENFSFRVGKELFLHDEFYGRIKRMIRRSSLDKSKPYRYSGLFFYLVPELVESMSGIRFETYLDSVFYVPLQAKTLVFNPLEKLDSGLMVPSEVDDYFRMEELKGVVNDEGAATMRGVSGNAGLFGSAEDLARVWLLFLNGGTKDSVRYLHPGTIDLFTARQYASNRRGLGFDKPLLDYDPARSSVARSASYRSFGHTGFTGTLVWADPETDLLFVFLSNRTWPDRTHKSIYRLNVRPVIHEMLYKYLRESRF